MSTFFQNLEQPVNLLNEQAFAANRRGEITTTQQKQLGSGAGWKRIILLALVIIILGGIFSFAFFPVILGGKWQTNLWPMLFIAALFLVLILFVGYGIWSQLNKTIKLKRDFANRAIRQGQGQLSHRKTGYVFEMGESTLRLPADLANGLLPGVTYQVYYLEESSLLLSAAATYQVATAQTVSALNEILASANRFSADDLLANHNNEVTFAQRRKLFPPIIFGVVIVLGSLAFLLPFVPIPLSFNARTSFLALLFPVIIVGILLLAGGVVLMKALLDVLAPKPQQVQGLVYSEKRVVNTGKSSHVEYNYIIDKLRFNVGHRAYTALIAGLKYRIYYLPRTKKLISIEALDVFSGNQNF